MRVRQRSIYLGFIAWLAVHHADPGALAHGQGVATARAGVANIQPPVPSASIVGSSKRLPRDLSVHRAADPQDLNVRQVAHEQFATSAPPAPELTSPSANSWPASGENLASNNGIALMPMMSIGQSGITLSPMTSQALGPGGVQPTSEGAVTLQPMQPTSQPAGRVAGLPFAVLPMSQNQNSNGPLTAKSQLSVAAMTGPMTDPMVMFSDLKTAPPAPGPLATPLRSDSNYMTWSPATYTWYTPTFAHQPLYFEQPNLERYGIGTYRWLQPAASSAHFFASISLMPYKLLTQHPRESVYPLGYDRPGNCAAYQGRPLLGQSRVGEAFKYWDACSGYR